VSGLPPASCREEAMRLKEKKKRVGVANRCKATTQQNNRHMTKNYQDEILYK
jgi:hypothetical protein